jgi:hypothetical protein
MSPKSDTSLILLTYKGKILLRLNDTNPEVYDNPKNTNKSTWSFLSVNKLKNKSFKESIIEKVEEDTSIRLSNAEFIADTIFNEQNKHFFHASLTDDNVNNMQRENGLTLQFFTLKEIDKLHLTDLTRIFLEGNKQVIENFRSL